MRGADSLQVSVRPLAGHLHDHLVVHVRHYRVARVLQALHGGRQKVAGDRLGDVLDDPAPVGLDLERAGALAARAVAQAAVVLIGPRPAVAERPPAREVDRKAAYRGISPGPRRAAGEPLRALAREGGVGGLLGVAPQGLDALVGVAPHPHHLRQLLGPDPLLESAHAPERLGPPW